MKKLFVTLLALLFISGCGAAARESGFYDHNAMYKNGDHLMFSIFGYKNIDSKEREQSNAQDWWGLPIEQSKQ